MKEKEEILTFIEESSARVEESNIRADKAKEEYDILSEILFDSL